MGLNASWYVKCIYVMLLLYLNLEHVCEMAEKPLLWFLTNHDYFIHKCLNNGCQVGEVYDR